MAIGLQREGDVLLKPFYPPYYEDMEEAVLAFRAYKFAPGMGTFRDGGVVNLDDRINSAAEEKWER